MKNTLLLKPELSQEIILEEGKQSFQSLELWKENLHNSRPLKYEEYDYTVILYNKIYKLYGFKIHSIILLICFPELFNSRNRKFVCYHNPEETEYEWQLPD